MIPVVVDLEASGFGSGSYPIEVGVAFADGSTFCSLIRPEADWTHWDSRAQRVHNIPRRTLLKHGRAASDIADELNQRLAGETIYSDAWGVDAPWLALLFHRTSTAQQFQVDSIRTLINEEEADRWGDNKQMIIDQLVLTRHRASSDALIIQNTLLYTKGLPLTINVRQTTARKALVE